MTTKIKETLSIARKSPKNRYRTPFFGAGSVSDGQAKSVAHASGSYRIGCVSCQPPSLAYSRIGFSSLAILSSCRYKPWESKLTEETRTQGRAKPLRLAVWFHVP